MAHARYPLPVALPYAIVIVSCFLLRREWLQLSVVTCRSEHLASLRHAGGIPAHGSCKGRAMRPNGELSAALSSVRSFTMHVRRSCPLHQSRVLHMPWPRTATQASDLYRCLILNRSVKSANNLRAMFMSGDFMPCRTSSVPSIALTTAGEGFGNHVHGHFVSYPKSRSERPHFIYP